MPQYATHHLLVLLRQDRATWHLLPVLELLFWLLVLHLVGLLLVLLQLFLCHLLLILVIIFLDWLINSVVAFADAFHGRWLLAGQHLGVALGLRARGRYLVHVEAGVDHDKLSRGVLGVVGPIGLQDGL